MGGPDLTRRRSLLIASLGPSVFLLGLVWTVLRLALTDPSLSFRGIVFAPPHQMMAIGAIIAAVCLPVARDVARATPDELRLPGFAAKQEHGETETPPQRRRRRSYQSYN